MADPHTEALRAQLGEMHAQEHQMAMELVMGGLPALLGAIPALMALVAFIRHGRQRRQLAAEISHAEAEQTVIKDEILVECEPDG